MASQASRVLLSGGEHVLASVCHPAYNKALCLAAVPDWSAARECAEVVETFILARDRMTFSIIARCPKTGAFGAAITTSDLAVGSRCINITHRKGAFLSQHRTDKRLGDLGIACLEDGASAAEAIERVVASSDDIAWRQLGAIDAHGGTAFHHGGRMYSIYTETAGSDCLALGNILANETITDAMVIAFASASDSSLAERLLRALEAGEVAGGEILGPLRSSALRVSGEDGIDAYDLRIDASKDSAISDLRALYEAYGDRQDALRRVALAPDEVPVQRALFEASVARIRERGLQERFPTEKHAQDWVLTT